MEYIPSEDEESVQIRSLQLQNLLQGSVIDSTRKISIHPLVRLIGQLVQRQERLVYTEDVTGSSPVLPTSDCCFEYISSCQVWYLTHSKRRQQW